MFHWQDRGRGAEVDIVLEATDGRVVGIEVKSGQTPKPQWFRWLAQMRDTIGAQVQGRGCPLRGRPGSPLG